MFSLERSDSFKKTLRKLFKKDRGRYEAVLKKVEEILCSGNPGHYKNLRYSLKVFKRVHVDSHFVLIFKVDPKRRIVKFYNVEHHDKIYRR